MEGKIITKNVNSVNAHSNFTNPFVKQSHSHMQKILKKNKIAKNIFFHVPFEYSIIVIRKGRENMVEFIIVTTTDRLSVDI